MARHNRNGRKNVHPRWKESWDFVERMNKSAPKRFPYDVLSAGQSNGIESSNSVPQSVVCDCLPGYFLGGVPELCACCGGIVRFSL